MPPTLPTVDNELIQVRKIRDSLITRNLPDLENLRFQFQRNRGSIDVAGDFDILRLSSDEVLFYLVNVYGPEISSTYVSRMLRMGFETCAKPETPVSEILLNVSRLISRNLPTAHEITCFAGLFDLRVNILHCCNAGHSGAVFFHEASKQAEFIPPANQPLEIVVRNPFVEMQIQVQEGDQLLIAYESLDRLSPDQPFQWKKLLSEIDSPAALQEKLREKLGHGLEPDFLICEITGTPRKNAYLRECGFPETEPVNIRTLHTFDEMKVLITHLVDQTDQFGYSIKFQKNFRLVLSELLTNAIVHGNKCQENKKVVAIYDVNPADIRFGVIDEGCGYNEQEVPNPLLPENIVKPHGRGIYIIKHFVEDFQLRGHGNCTVVRLKRERA